jgi:two-component system CheB/CheR fusion protein
MLGKSEMFLMPTLPDSAFDLGHTPQIVIDADGLLVLANDPARRMLGLGVKDIGRPIQDLDVSNRPVELRARLDRIAGDPKPISIDGVRWRSHAGQARVLDVKLTPVVSEDELLATTVAFIDITDAFTLETELRESESALEQAHEELQSTVEELERTNEELQSTNEELETMNEELRSTNEELETMNDELRQRTFELNDVDAFLETILDTIGLAVAVLDRRQHVQLWSGRARDLWGLSPEETEGQHVLGLDIGLPVEELKPLLRAALNGNGERQQITVDAVNRGGKPVRCLVSCLPLSALNDGDVTGVILMMEPVLIPPDASARAGP